MLNIFPLDYVTIVATSTVTLSDNTTLASPAVNLADYDFVLFIVNATDANADTTIDVELQTDSASGFSTPTTLAVNSDDVDITQDTLANASQAYALEVRADQVTNGDTFVRALATLGNGTTGGNTSIVALGFGGNYKPGTHAATVIETKRAGVA